jgi:uncharacterized protein (DUF697 family)
MRLWARNRGMTELELYQAPNVQVPVPSGVAEHQACERLIRERALWCAGVSLEPVPFLDLLAILPMHIKMVVDIGKVYGFEMTKERAKEIALELAGTLAINYASRVATRSILKAVPMLGSLVNTPMVYATTYTLGMLAERYFRARRPELPPIEGKITQDLVSQAKQMALQLDWREMLRGFEKMRKK